MASNESTMKFRADISQLRAEMQAAGRAIRVANSEFKAATAGTDNWSKSTDGLQAKIKQLNTVLNSQKRQLELAQQELEKCAKEYGENSAETDRARIKVNNYQAAVNKTEKELDDYEKSLNEVTNETKDTTAATEKAKDGFTVMKGALASLVADGIRLAINGLKDLAKETYNAGANFESAMSKVQAVSGASAEEIDLLTAKAKEMGEKTKFSASESAEAFNYMAMAGWKTEDMIGGIEGIMNLAAASGADLATTSDIVTDALTAMGYSAKDAGRLADVMAAASSNANTNVEMMGQTFQYAAPIVGALGYNMEDTAVAIGLMANAGIKGEKAGTALRSILTRLSAPPKECADAMEKLGIEITNADGTMKPFETVIKDLRKSFDGLSESEQTQLAKHIAGQEAMSGLLAIVNAAPADFNKLTKAVEDSTGAAAEMADTMNDNVSGQITLLKSKIEGIMIKVFEKASGSIRKAIDNISKTLDKVDWSKFADKAGASIEKLVNLFTWIIEHGNGVATTLKVIGTGFAAIFVTQKAWGFYQALTGIPGAIASMEKGTIAATAATKALGLAQAALPWVAVAAGCAAVAAAYVAYKNKTLEAARAEYELTEEQQKSVDAVTSSKQAIEDLATARNEAIASANGEYNYLNQLTDEYNSLIDSNGKVKKGYEDRANFILTTLANSLGVERSEIEKNIGKNGELKQSINDLIETQRAQAYLAANETAYQNAIANKDKAIQEYGAALRTLDEAEQKYTESQKANANVLETYNELLKTAPDQAYRYKAANAEVIAANDEAKASYDKAKQAVADAEANYIEYNNTIANYEGLSAAIISGDQQKISAALQTMKNDFITSENGTREVLERQLKDFQDKYYNMQAAVNAGMPGVTQAEVDAMGKMVDQAKAELDKLPPDAKKAGEKAGKEHAKGVSSTTGANKTAGKKVGKAATDGQKTGGNSAKKTGEKAGTDYAKGVESKKGAAKKAGETVGKQADTGAKTADNNMKKAGEKSADEYNKGVESKKDKSKTAGKALGDNAKTGAGSVSGTSSGENFGQGYINGINAKKQAAYNAGYALGRQGAAGLKAGQQEGSPSKLTYKSGVYFVQGYINGISSEQGKLISTVQNMVGTVIKELGKLNNYNFSEVGNNAATKFTDTISKQAQYMFKKMQYQNEQLVKDYDNTIAGLEATRDKDITKLEKETNKNVSKLEKERDKKLKELEKKRDKLGSSKKDQAEKKKLNNQIKSIKESYKKRINAEKSGSKKEIDATKKEYEKKIEKQKKYKEAYQNASSEMISEFQNAMNEYQNAAKQLIDDTINGITEKYNQRYNELITKQDTLINKLKSAGDLFEISGAGVMTVNDIKEQTKQIKDYTAKLAKIKAKVSSELFDEIASYDMKEGGAFIDRLLEMSASDLDAYNKAYTEKMQAAQKAGESIYESDFDKVAKDYEKEINSAFKGIDKQLKELGDQAMKGFIDGLTTNTNYMDKNVKTFVESMVNTFKKELKIKSPSKVMFGIGEFTGEGFDNGLMSMVKGVQETARKIANAASFPLEGITDNVNGVKAAIGQNNGVYGGTNSNIVNNYNLVQNNNSPKALTALETYQARRRQIAMMKAATQNA